MKTRSSYEELQKVGTPLNHAPIMILTIHILRIGTYFLFVQIRYLIKYIVHCLIIPVEKDRMWICSGVFGSLAV